MMNLSYHRVRVSVLSSGNIFPTSPIIYAILAHVPHTQRHTVSQYVLIDSCSFCGSLAELLRYSFFSASPLFLFVRIIKRITRAYVCHQLACFCLAALIYRLDSTTENVGFRVNSGSDSSDNKCVSKNPRDCRR